MRVNEDIHKLQLTIIELRKENERLVVLEEENKKLRSRIQVLETQLQSMKKGA